MFLELEEIDWTNASNSMPPDSKDGKKENVIFFFSISISHCKLVWLQFDVSFEVAFFLYIYIYIYIIERAPIGPAVWNVPICLCVYVCILSTAAADQLRAGGPWHQCGWREARYWSPAGPRFWTTGRFPIFRSSFTFSPSSYLLSPSVCKASCAAVFLVLGALWDMCSHSAWLLKLQNLKSLILIKKSLKENWALCAKW